MRNLIKSFSLCVLTFALTVVILFGFLAVAASIPNEKIRDNMIESANVYDERSTYQRVFDDRINSTADNYADVILHGIAWNMGRGEILESILDTKYNDGELKGDSTGTNVIRGFYLTVTQDLAPNKDYTRYVHGNAAFVRILHLFTNTDGVKLVGFIAIFLSLALTCFVLIRKKHLKIAIMLALSLIAVQFWYLSLSIEYQAPFLICFLLCPLYLFFESRSRTALIVISVAGGTMVAFFDFLTTETVALLIPLLLIIAVRESEGRLGELKYELTGVALNGASFLLAYAATFITKWGIASAVTGENKFSAALSFARDRAVGTGVMGSNIEDPVSQALYALLGNLTALFGGASRVGIKIVVVGILSVAAVIGAAFLVLVRKKANKTALVLFAVIGAIPPLRFLILSNHSYVHTFFTYRALVSSVFALLLCMSLLLALKAEKAQNSTHNKRRKRT